MLKSAIFKFDLNITLLNILKMETKIVQWVQCDDQIKAYNDKMKEKIAPVKQMRDKLSDEILKEINISEIEKSQIPTFNIQSLNTSIVPTVNNSYEGYTNKFLNECFTEYFNSEEKAKELLTFMKNKRKVEKKYSLKRNHLMDLND
tara:strand:- start:43 stop:480 length:438 start_codon:yes stop_codon:yes gene_type:complete